METDSTWKLIPCGNQFHAETNSMWNQLLCGNSYSLSKFTVNAECAQTGLPYLLHLTVLLLNVFKQICQKSI